MKVQLLLIGAIFSISMQGFPAHAAGMTPDSAVVTAVVDDVTERAMGATSNEVTDNSGVMILASNDDKKAPPVAGYGDKTEEEIAKEKPKNPYIAVVGPMTGKLEYFGNEASNGAEMAADEINEKGGIKGVEFEFFVLDTAGEISKARAAFEVCVNKEVLAVVGAATGEVSFSSNKMINESQMILLSAGSRRRLGDTGPFNFRITLSEKLAVDGLLKYIKAGKKWKNFAIFSSVVDDYSIQLSASFKLGLIDNGMNISHELWLWSAQTTNIADDDSSIEAQVKKLKNNPPDALIYTSEGKEASEIVRELRKQGLNIPIIGGEDLMVPEFTDLGKDVEGSVIYSGFNPDSERPETKKFVEAYKKRFGKEPGRLAALSYDAYYMIAQAVERSPDLRPSRVRKELTNTANYKGVTGTTTMTSGREAVKEPFILEVKKVGGSYKFVGIKDPS